MSEVENQEVEVSAVEQLINQITDGDLNSAEGSFQSLIQDKMADALEAQKVAVAQALFNDQDDDIEVEEEEIELEDEEEEVEDDEEEVIAELDDDEGE